MKKWKCLVVLCALLIGSWAMTLSTYAGYDGNELTKDDSGKTLMGGAYYLTDNVTLTDKLTISGTVVIELNGYTLSRKNSSESAPAIEVAKGANLTVTDGVENETVGIDGVVKNIGTLTGGTFRNTVYNTGVSGSTIKVNSGTIKDGIFYGKVINKHGYNICTISNGTFYNTVENYNRGCIKGGTYYEDVTMLTGANISGGIFYGDLSNATPSMVSGGNYKVEFVLNGGSWKAGYTAPTTYTYNTSSVSLVLPTVNEVSNGYLSFDGWYDNAEYSGKPITSIAKKTFGKQVYYAKFTDEITSWENAVGKAEEGTDYEVDEEGNYEIITALGLSKIAEIVNNGDSMKGKTVTLEADIDLAEGGVEGYPTSLTVRNSWIPIDGFEGTFDGNNKEIKNLYILSENENAGLFGINRGTIKNLKIASGKIVLQGTISGERHIGAVAATSTGLISNCENHAEICAENIVGYDSLDSLYVGGIAGFVSTSENDVSIVEDCINCGQISVTGTLSSNMAVGGVVGYLFSGRVVNKKTLVNHCWNKAEIMLVNKYVGAGWSGGIAGVIKGVSYGEYLLTATLTNCRNDGSVGGKIAGGVVGYNGIAGSIYNCHNMNDVKGVDHAGGIVGLNYGSYTTVENCYNIGEACDAKTQGGIAGGVTSGRISNCYYLSGISEEAFGSSEENTVIENCKKIVSVDGTHLVETETRANNSLLMVLNQWVVSQEASDYMCWIADEENQNYPILSEVCITYPITILESKGGAASASMDSARAGERVILTASSVQGYQFKGWKVVKGEAAITDNEFIMPSESTTLKAIFEKESYQITYELSGGRGENPLVYDVESEEIHLKNPTREGYEFVGWSGTNLIGDTNMEVVIPQGSVGDRTYTAHWKEILADEDKSDEDSDKEWEPDEEPKPEQDKEQQPEQQPEQGEEQQPEQGEEARPGQEQNSEPEVSDEKKAPDTGDRVHICFLAFWCLSSLVVMLTRWKSDKNRM